MSDSYSNRESVSAAANPVHRLRRLRSRRNPDLQRASLRTYIDRIEEFELALDPENVGEAEGWYLPGRKTFELTARIGPVELLPSYIPPSASGKTVVWYHKTILIENPRPVKHYKINFARAFYATKVWANGQLLEDVDGQTVHISGFASFSYDLTSYLDQDGKIELVVRVENSDDPTYCRGKQASQRYSREGIWYGWESGLWGQVTLEEVSANRLRSDVTGYGDPQTGLVRLEAMTYIVEEGQYSLEAAVDTAEGENAVLYRRLLNLKPGQQTHQLAFGVPQPLAWSPQQPALYEVEINLRREGELLDRVYFKFGFRSLTTRGSQFELNGERIYLDGVLFQPYQGDSYTLEYDQLKAQLEYTRQVLGCNLLRIHIAGADPLPLYLADELGLIVWVEVPSPHISNEQSRANHWRELNSLLRQIDAHPCVCLVSIYNESWGCEDVSRSGSAGEATRAYIKQAYDHIKRVRPDLLVVDNDGWEHVVEQGELIATDFLSLHIYEKEVSDWRQTISKIQDLAAEANPAYPKLTGHPVTTSSGYSYRREKPIVISEWGGFGALYGGPAAQLEKFKLIRQYKEVLEENQALIGGDCYTQLGDVENETNGLLDKAGARLEDAQFRQASTGLLATTDQPSQE
jgi:beta-galactosidase/beta-glucuronidase